VGSTTTPNWPGGLGAAPAGLGTTTSAAYVGTASAAAVLGTTPAPTDLHSVPTLLSFGWKSDGLRCGRPAITVGAHSVHVASYGS
jgi:hypothetical protein